MGEAARPSPASFPAKAFAAHSHNSPLSEHSIQRRSPRPQDVQIEVLFCGVCHSDLHTVRNEWKEVMPTVYPCVPGHEIVGRVVKVGNTVKKFKEADIVAVGCMVDSCRICASCKAGEEQYCENGMTLTYNSEDKFLGGVTYGGYSRWRQFWFGASVRGLQRLFGGQKRVHFVLMRQLRPQRTGRAKADPIFRRKANAPDVAGLLQFQSDLEQLANGARTLNPGHPATHLARRLAGLRMRNLQRHPHVFQHVMLGLEAAAVAVDDQAGSALDERTAQGVHTLDHQRNGLHDARTAALAKLFGRINGVFRQHLPTIHRVRAALRVVATMVGTLSAKLVHTRRFAPRLSCWF